MPAPEWTKKISSNAVCNWYYILFIANCVIIGLVLLYMFGVMPFLRLPKGVLIGQGFTALISGAIVIVNALFLYVMCDRSLLEPSRQ